MLMCWGRLAALPQPPTNTEAHSIQPDANLDPCCSRPFAIPWRGVPVVSLAAGWSHTLFADGMMIRIRPTMCPMFQHPHNSESGCVWGVGDNTHGQLGELLPTTTTTLCAIAVCTRVRQVAAGLRHSLALLVDGRVIAWGANRKAQCGVHRVWELIGIVLMSGAGFTT